MSIVENKKAYHDYFIEEKFEAGPRARRLGGEGDPRRPRAAQGGLRDRQGRRDHADRRPHHAAVDRLDARAPRSDARRARCCSIASEINRLVGQVERAGYTLVPLNLHYSKGRVKLDIGLAKGKKQHDKRETEKLRDWNREKQRLLRNRTGRSPG